MKTLLAFFLTIMFSVQAGASSNESPVIDFEKLKKSNWTNQENRHAELIVDFVQNLMNNHNFEYVLTTYNNSAYKQHNRNLPDKIRFQNGFAHFVGPTRAHMGPCRTREREMSRGHNLQ